MATTIDYYFTLISPWAYLGHSTLLDIARRHSATLVYKPVKLMGVWEISGSVPLASRSDTRKRYRLIELQRYSELRGLEINLSPKYFPTNPSLADRVAIALIESGKDPAGFMARVFAGLWTGEKDIADPETLAAWLDEEGSDATAVLEAAANEAVAAIYAANTKDAIEADAIGVPAYVLNGEVFWGQDRLDLLDRALESGRRPFRP